MESNRVPLSGLGANGRWVSDINSLLSKEVPHYPLALLGASQLNAFVYVEFVLPLTLLCVFR